MYSTACLMALLQMSLYVLLWQNYREETKKQRQLLQTLERERDRYGKEASDAQQSCIAQV